MATEFNLYIISNLCILLAGCMIFKNHFDEVFRSNSQGSSATSVKARKNRLIISRDTEVLLFVSTIARTYWCCSPPELWYHDPYMTRFICVADLVLSCILWTGIVILGHFNHQQYRSNKDFDGKLIAPRWAQWPAQLALSLLILSPIARLFIDQEHENINHSKSGAAFPYADYAIMVNMTLDTMAMIPQMFVISRGEDDMCSRATSNFVGLMGAARIFRMCFWVISMIINYLATGGYILWYFIVPDLVHTMVMGEYVWVWVHRLRKETADLFAV